MADLEERIRERAYAICESEGRPHGRDLEHWRRAAAELAEEERKNRPEAAGELSSGDRATVRSEPVHQVRRADARSQPDTAASGSGRQRRSAPRRAPDAGKRDEQKG